MHRGEACRACLPSFLPDRAGEPAERSGLDDDFAAAPELLAVEQLAGEAELLRGVGEIELADLEAILDIRLLVQVAVDTAAIQRDRTRTVHLDGAGLDLANVEVGFAEQDDLERLVLVGEL